MKELTFFAKPQHYYKRGTVTSRNPHLFRTSSLIRGEQIAHHMGCKYNPTEGYEDDVCIYVKPNVFDDIKDGSWVDVLDNFRLLKLLEKRPGIGIIFCSQYHYDLLKGNYKNKSVFIPHHHCNFERYVRTLRDVKTVGYLGSIRGIALSVPEFTDRLKDIGLDFITNYHFKTREDVINFYRKIDIQIVWKKDRMSGVTPLKITNAASVGIPSVSKHMENFQELDGLYIPVASDIDSLVSELEKLKEQDYYNSWSRKLIPAMEKYHISNIAELYEQLL